MGSAFFADDAPSTAVDPTAAVDAVVAGLPAEQRTALVDAAMTDMRTRVGDRLAEGLSEHDAEAFDQMNQGDRAAILAWLESEGMGTVEDYAQTATPELQTFALKLFMRLKTPDRARIMNEELTRAVKRLATTVDGLGGHSPER